MQNLYFIAIFSITFNIVFSMQSNQTSSNFTPNSPTVMQGSKRADSKTLESLMHSPVDPYIALHSALLGHFDDEDDDNNSSQLYSPQDVTPDQQQSHKEFLHTTTIQTAIAITSTNSRDNYQSFHTMKPPAKATPHTYDNDSDFDIISIPPKSPTTTLASDFVYIDMIKNPDDDELDAR
jgi:hypothetical protein